MSACPAMEVVLRSVQTPMEATFVHVRLAICLMSTTEHAMVSLSVQLMKQKSSKF